jgi:hypothetical protein
MSGLSVSVDAMIYYRVDVSRLKPDEDKRRSLSLSTKECELVSR